MPLDQSLEAKNAINDIAPALRPFQKQRLGPLKLFHNTVTPPARQPFAEHATEHMLFERTVPPSIPGVWRNPFSALYRGEDTVQKKLCRVALPWWVRITHAIVRPRKLISKLSRARSDRGWGAALVIACACAPLIIQEHARLHGQSTQPTISCRSATLLPVRCKQSSDRRNSAKNLGDGADEARVAKLRNATR
jgi:hypothetical protein